MNQRDSERHDARMNSQAVTEEGKVNHDYDDIINLPHYEPKHHPRMPMQSRAAQFAPFAALTGYDAAIRESGRLTDDWTEMGDSDNEELNRKMTELASVLSARPTVTIEYFLPDSRKSGGSYQSITGQVKRIDEHEKCIVFTDGTRIPTETIKGIKL